MLEQLQAIGTRCYGGAFETHAVAADRAQLRAAGRPADVLQLAETWCRRALALRPVRSTTVAEQGALALIEYLAALPDDVRDGIEPLPGFRDDIVKAWLEPCADAYVSLCNTVQDVWSHVLGPESAIDEEVLSELMSAPIEKALDFGAGAGHFSVGLALRGVDVDAVDVDAVKSSFLAFRATRAGVSHRVHLGLRRVNYDTVIAVEVLDHLLDPAAALRALIGRVAPGGRLITLARFHDDGWHQADAAAIAACAQLLWTHLEPAAPARARLPWLDVFVRPRQAAAARLPRLHPRACIEPRPGGQWLLAAPVFYSGACLLDEDTRAFCDCLDGSRSIEQLQALTGFGGDEIRQLCELLYGQRLLHWREPRPARVEETAGAV